MKLKGMMIYLSDHEKKIFSEYADRHKKSISSSIKDLALSCIASSNIEITQPDNTEISHLKERIELLENQLSDTEIKDHIKRMTIKIYRSIKDEWITVNELHNLFNINTEEEHDDFIIAFHEFQELYLDEFEFNSFKNAYRRKL